MSSFPCTFWALFLHYTLIDSVQCIFVLKIKEYGSYFDEENLDNKNSTQAKIHKHSRTYKTIRKI
jgi:hypothetical protein